MADINQIIQEVQALPRIERGVYERTDKEAKTFRSRLYAINRNNAPGWKWRTMREGQLMLVWRLS